MYHQHDTEWDAEDNEQILSSRMPKNFHKVMAHHYAERLQQVIQKGLRYTAQYFFVRNSLKHHKTQR